MWRGLQLVVSEDEDGVRISIIESSKSGEEQQLGSVLLFLGQVDELVRSLIVAKDASELNLTIHGGA